MHGRRVRHRPVPVQLRDAFGDRLRSLRKIKKLSQEKLGFASGLSGKFIGEVERGEKSISFDSLYYVARALDVGLPVLLYFREDQPTKQTEELYALAVTQKPKKLNELLHVARAMVA